MAAGVTLFDDVHQLGISLRWHFDVAIRLLRLVLNSEEAPFNLFQNCRIVVDHPAIEENLSKG